jgi:hypothetical protein
MFVPRYIPQDAIKEKLKFYDDPDFGMVNFSGDGELNDEELINIKYLDDIVLVGSELNLYFPAYDNYMVTTYFSDSGKYTLRQVLKLANKVGFIFYNLYSEEKEGDIIGEYALCNYYIKDNNIYLEPDH